MEYIVILNGEKPKIDKSFFSGKKIICADGAYTYAENIELNVDLLIGDFDSLKNIPKNVEIKRFKSDKDFTDGELAIDEAINSGAEKITIIGAAGGRDDHYYANIMLLYRALLKGVFTVIKTDYTEIFMFNKNSIFTVIKGNYFSLVPFGGNLHIINTEGLKYKIADKILYQHQTLGISNITTENTVKIDIKSGCGIAFATFETAVNNL